MISAFWSVRTTIDEIYSTYIDAKELFNQFWQSVEMIGGKGQVLLMVPTSWFGDQNEKYFLPQTSICYESLRGGRHER